MMNFPVYPTGGGIMPLPDFGPPSSLKSCLPAGYCPPTVWQAVSALPPSMYRTACECRSIYGAGYGAILTNLLGKVSFAVSGNFRIRDRNGRSMPLSLHIRFAGARLSGKSEAHKRLNESIAKAMKSWKKRWLFNNATVAALLRRLRAGSIWSMLSMPEGRGHLSSPLSCSFQDLSDLYDGNMPSFDRADDDDEEIDANAPDDVIFITCVNVQDDAHRDWLDRYLKSAIASGYLFRLLIIETDELAIEGAGSQQPEFALLDYDHRIAELISSGWFNLKAMPASRLPMIEVSAEAEQILREGQQRFGYMASAALSPRDAIVFAVRLVANARRIAGCMHVFERYEGVVSADTMTRAVTIAECFGAHWLATVFPPKPIPDALQRAQRLLDYLYSYARQSGWRTVSWRKSDVEAWVPNFGWTKGEMTEAIRLICGQGFAQVMPRTENSRRVIKLELIQPNIFPFAGQGYSPMKNWR